MKSLQEALRVQFIIQIYLGQSPFQLKNNKFQRSRSIELYYIICPILYVPFVLYNLFGMLHESNAIFTTEGYLWSLIAAFELIFTNIAFPLLLLHSYLWRLDQINFWNRMIAIDNVLRTQFQIDFHKLYTKIRRRTIVVLAFCFLYYCGIAISICNTLKAVDLIRFHTVLFSLCYQTEQCGTGLFTIALINKLLTLRTRFRLLRLSQAGLIAPFNKPSSGQPIAVWTKTFKELCGLIDLLSRKIGMLLLLRFAHDFTLLTSQCYLIFWTINDDDPDEWIYNIGVVSYWMVQNIVKIGAMGWLAHVTANEV